MDLLSRYQQEHPEAFREQPKWQPSSEYGFFVRLVLRLSGGRVQDARQANTVLLICGIIIAISAVSIFIFAFGQGGGTPLPYEETYKPVQ